MKSSAQRTEAENHLVDRGLIRSLVLEALLFVPASSTLILLIHHLIIPDAVLKNQQLRAGIFGLLGIVSYGFPFSTFRRIVVRLALKTLREFVELLPKEVRAETEPDVLKDKRQS